MTERIVRLSSGVHFAAGADEDLLAAAQRAHWLVRYGCRNGNCQACAATLLEGTVVQDGTLIAATQPIAPTILLCLCRAQSDLLIALPGDPLHGSSAQARRLYSRLDSVRYGAPAGDGFEAELRIALPAGRLAPMYPGQYMLIEHGGDVLRADIDTSVSAGRDLCLLCATARDFATQRYVTTIGPLGYCYAPDAAVPVLILRDSLHSRQARLLKDALPHAQLCDARHIDRLAAAQQPFTTVLACAQDAAQAEQWYHALLDAGIAFDEFRSDDTLLYRWSVWRQDDNANRFLVRAGLSESGARALVDDYERHGHKQLYWAEPMTPRSREMEPGE